MSIVASFREDGIKLSVRSEDPEVHAGNKALADVGSGGGHSTMGGGFISREKVSLLGNYPKDRIRDLFLNVLSDQ